MKKILTKAKSIFLIGPVEYNMCKTALEELRDTDWVGEGINTLHITINSEGGILVDCFALIDMIEIYKARYKLHIVTCGTGMIASAGVFLFLLGDTRILTENCRVFVHEHITVDQEQTYSERLRSDKTEQKDIYKIYFNYAMKKLGLPKKKVVSFLKKNNWLTKKEIEEFGLNKI
jgi:ATP-dependent protease ClpP protease subunit